jgi:hypothetical protein
MKIKQIIIAFIVLGLFIILILAVKWTKRFFQIDACLDAGGKWNYELNNCEPHVMPNSSTLIDFYWHADFDTILNKEFLIRGRMLDSISKSPDELIKILNRRNPKCKIEYIDLRKDTVIIRILEDEFLSEQMGTTGADCYLGETIYTLTENDQIKFVRIEMDYGSHAGPGVYSRNDYNRLIIEK